MNAGNLSERIAILRKSTTKDSFGQPVTTWATLKTVWAQASELRAREFFESSAKQVEVTTRFRLRYTDFEYTDRIRWDSHDYEPVQIITLGRKAGLEILAKRLDGFERDA